MRSMSETTFAERLRGLRARVALTQAELAQRAGIDPATVARLEQSQTAPRPTTIRKLARALGVELSALTVGEAG
jgi:transcriptional regulator with XRE-family HTH domain